MMPLSARRVVTNPPWILAGDIGGTKVNLAGFSIADGHPRLIQQQTYKTQDYAGLEPVLSAFLADGRQTADSPMLAACIGAAGPMDRGICRPVNYPWVIDQSAIRSFLKCERVELLNDLQALAYGSLRLAPSALATINPGQLQPDATVRVMLAAGTGLGEGILHRVGLDWHTIASEGSHANFAPTSALEDELLSFLRGRFPQISFDMLLSGKGIHLIYQFLKAHEGDHGAGMA